MLNIENKDKFGKVIAGALAQVELTVKDATTKKRWINAISKAVVEIEQNSVFMTWLEESHALLIWSQRSNNIYTANGTCQCRAFAQKTPCFHRTAARLVRLYLEAENNPAPVQVSADEMNNAPYLKPTVEHPVERVGGIRIN